ncbi:glycoside hydrolase family 35 protein [Terriglobus aquaticus]|uniref:Beta-galactosidase n=1 Tax=Terriglobus aquaticus TaxID=940139 RepID=A0ABW9KQ63_9BACT|nr:glycoside hydrolase family 35 protein [Terriglobus aquaticus]
MLTGLLLCGALQAHAQTAADHSFRVADGKFLLDGKPFQIISGEMHYARVPREYWRSRFRMAKAMGLNTITTYVFWNVHETEPGKYDFSGNADVAEFVREAQQEGLYVILRPGPYACAEWEFGGYPAWLLKDPDMKVRSRDPKFLKAARRWMLRLGKEVAPLQIGNGGPIIAVQVENEYGSYGDDHEYMEDIHHMLMDAGFTKAQLYTADGADELTRGSLPELPAVINFGTGEAKGEFAKLHKLRPQGPFMSGEYWAGWFDHWGAKHETRSPQEEADEVGWMLKQGYSVSMYMFHGGTSFGFMNGANADGANSEGKNYQPDVTSYDYDAPLDESGRETPKYDLLRKTIAEATGTTPTPVPTIAPAQQFAPVHMTGAVPLWSVLPKPVPSQQPLAMEELNQAYGYVLYRTTMQGPVQGEVNLGKLHSYAQVYVNGRLIGTVDRRYDQHALPLDLPAGPAVLDILVENTGRVNYGKAIPGERVGLLGGVNVGGRPVTGWQNFPLPLTDPTQYKYTAQACSGACFYRGSFTVPRQADTFLDTSGFTKGQVWVNGHNLGRVWDVGPQKALYLPGPWLRKGTNEVVVLDLQGQPGVKVWGLDHPDLDGAVIRPATMK